MTAIRPKRQMIADAVTFLLNIIDSCCDLLLLPVFVCVVSQTTSRAGKACKGKVKMTATLYANWTMVDRDPFGSEAVRAVCTESPKDALKE